jgi:hypothetical protein
VGTYTFHLATLQRTLVIHVAEEDGRLVTWADAKPKLALIPLGNHVFGAKSDPQFRLTFTVVAGRATRARLEETGMLKPVEGVRAP